MLDQIGFWISYFYVFLVLLIIHGVNNILFFDIAETKCSSLARSEPGSQKDPLTNGITSTKTETNYQQGAASNGLPKIIVPPTAKTTQMVSAAVAAASTDLPKIPPFPQNGGNNKPKD